MYKTPMRERNNMENQSYYLTPGPEKCNISDQTVPLRVNCVGFCKRLKPFKTSEPSGRHDYYLQYIVEDELVIAVGGKEKRYPKGTFTVYPPGTPYCYKSPNARVRYFWAHFTGFHVGRLLVNLGIIPGKIYRTSAAYKTSSHISYMFVRMFDEFSQRRPGFLDETASLLTEVLVALSREVSKTRAGETRSLSSIAYLHHHFRDNTPISELAAMDHLGVSRYREVFHEQMGMSPIDYRIALRIQHACELLSQTDYTIAVVSIESGFADVFYFARMFKAKTGMTPKKYRDEAFKQKDNA